MADPKYSPDNPFAVASQASGVYSPDNPFVQANPRLEAIRARRAELEEEMARDKAGDAVFFQEQAAQGLMGADLADRLTRNAPPLEGGTQRPRRQNLDGTVSSELSITVPDPRLPGSWMNIPSMFGGQEVPEDEAVRRIRAAGFKDPETGRPIGSFGTVDEAVSAAQARSDALPSQTTPAPATPTEAAPEPRPGRSVMEYLTETVQNVPESAGDVLSGMWEAISNPVQTAEALGSAFVGGVQLGKDALGIPTNNVFGDQRDAARAVGEFYADRYGGGQEILDTIRTDPAGAVLDALGLATGGAGAAARAPGVAGQVARTVASADPAATAGRAIEAATRGASRTPSRKAFIAGAPGGEAMRKEAGALYDAAAAAGVRFPQADYASFVDNISATLAKEGADPVLSPKVVRLQKLLEESRGQAPDLQRMETVRRQFLDAASSADPAERRLAQIGVDAVDDFVENASESTAGTLKEARSLWRRMRKAEVIDDAVENATLAKEGVEAGLRNQFSTLYRQRKSKKMRGFSDDELAAIKAVAQGNFTSNVLRRIGSLSGGTGAQRNMLNLLVGSGVGGGAGAALGGPVGGAFGAAAVPIAGHIAQRAAQRRTQQAADLVRAMTARGTTPARARLPRPIVRGAGRLAGQAPPVGNPLAAILANTEEWR